MLLLLLCAWPTAASNHQEKKGTGPLPPFPDRLPAPTAMDTRVTLRTDRAVATSGGAAYASFNFDWHCGFADAKKWRCPGEPGWDHSSVNFGMPLDDPGLVA